MTIFATLPESAQRILIDGAVLDHIARHRQLSWYAREAGGQLFGSIAAGEVVVSVATGPYRGDQRRRSSYRSNPTAAQRAVDLHSRNGLFYLGEWHTHPEEHPKASMDDYDAMSRLRNLSVARTSALLMLIQGKAAGAKGLCVYSLGSDGFSRWALSDGHPIAEHCHVQGERI